MRYTDAQKRDVLKPERFRKTISLLFSDILGTKKGISRRSDFQLPREVGRLDEDRPPTNAVRSRRRKVDKEGEQNSRR
jgi:hypothetical protein